MACYISNQYIVFDYIETCPPVDFEFEECLHATEIVDQIVHTSEIVDQLITTSELVDEITVTTAIQGCG